MRLSLVLIAVCLWGCEPVTAPTPVVVEPVVETPVETGPTMDLCDLYTGKDRETCLAFQPWGRPR